MIQSAEGNESFSMKMEREGDCQLGCQQDIRESTDRTAETIYISVCQTKVNCMPHFFHQATLI